MSFFRARPLAFSVSVYLLTIALLIFTEAYEGILFLFLGACALPAAKTLFHLFHKKEKAAERVLRGSVLLFFAFLVFFLSCLHLSLCILRPAQELRGSSTLCEGRVIAVPSEEALILQREDGVKIFARRTESTLQEAPVEVNDQIRARLLCDEALRDPDHSLRSRGILVTAELEHLQTVGKTEPSLLQRISEGLRRGFSPLKYRHLADALLLGNTELGSPSLFEALSNTQTQHIISVSGLHVSLLLLTFERWLNRTRLSLVGRALLFLLVLLIYCALLGFAPAVTRAGLMALMGLGARFCRRNNDSLSSLMLSAGILCFFDPFTLFDSSFQLSFLSTLGIVKLCIPLSERMELSPFFKDRSPFAAWGKTLWKNLLQSLLMTFSALIPSLCVLLRLSPHLNLFSFLPNLLLIPLFTPALTLIFLYLPVSTLLSAVGAQFLLWPFSKLCDLLLFLFDLAVGLLGGKESFLSLSSRESYLPVITVALLSLAAFFFLPPRRLRLLLLSLLLTLPLLWGAHRGTQLWQKAKITLLNCPQQQAVLVTTEATNLLWLPEGCTEPELLCAALKEEAPSRLDLLAVPKGNAEECLFYLSELCFVEALYVKNPPSPSLQKLCAETDTALRYLPEGELSPSPDLVLRHQSGLEGTSLDLLFNDQSVSLRFGFCTVPVHYRCGFEKAPDYAVFFSSPLLLPSEELNDVGFLAWDTPFASFEGEFLPLSEAHCLSLSLFPDFHLSFYEDLSQLLSESTERKFSTSAS